jgi:MoxR-like ATPase
MGMSDNQDVGAIKLKISEVKDAVRLCMTNNLPVMLWGPPGVGKSEAMQQLGKEQNRVVLDLRMSLLNPVDIRGVPVAKDGLTVWWAPGFLPRDGTATETAILFLDEINLAPQAVQAASYQLVLDRRVGEYILPKGVSIVAAGNRGTDFANVFGMSSALRNRFVHYEIAPDLDEWKSWALKNDIRSEVVAYLNQKQDHLFFFDAKVHLRQFPTPRSWVFASRLLNGITDMDSASKLLSGALGEAVATAFAGFLRVADKLPNAEDIIVRGNMDIKAPTKSQELYAFSGALVGVARRHKDKLKAGRNLAKYCSSGLPAEFAILTGKDYARTDTFDEICNKLIVSEEWEQFAEKYGEAIVE